jgi:hypothetical protein
VRILDSWCERGGERDVTAVAQGEECTACIEVEFLDPIVDPIFSMTFRNDVRHTIYVARSDSAGPMGAFAAGERSTIRFSFPNWLAQSTYKLTPAVITGDMRVTLDQRIDAVTLRVDSARVTGGVADLPTAIEVKRS